MAFFGALKSLINSRNLSTVNSELLRQLEKLYTYNKLLYYTHYTAHLNLNNKIRYCYVNTANSFMICTTGYKDNETFFLMQFRVNEHENKTHLSANRFISAYFDLKIFNAI